jgi:hypothetical protein
MQKQHLKNITIQKNKKNKKKKQIKKIYLYFYVLCVVISLFRLKKLNIITTVNEIIIFQIKLNNYYIILF